MEEKKHSEELQFLKRTNAQLKVRELGAYFWKFNHQSCNVLHSNKYCAGHCTQQHDTAWRVVTQTESWSNEWPFKKSNQSHVSITEPARGDNCSKQKIDIDGQDNNNTLMLSAVKNLTYPEFELSNQGNYDGRQRSLLYWVSLYMRSYAVRGLQSLDVKMLIMVVNRRSPTTLWLVVISFGPYQPKTESSPRTGPSCERDFALYKSGQGFILSIKSVFWKQFWNIP